MKMNTNHWMLFFFGLLVQLQVYATTDRTEWMDIYSKVEMYERHRPALPKIRSGRISVNFEKTCVADDIGVHCFGNNEFGQIDVPKDVTS